MAVLRRETILVSSQLFNQIKAKKRGGKIIIPASLQEKTIFTARPSDIDRAVFKHGDSFVEHEFEGAEEWGDWIRFYLGDLKLKKI